MRSAYLVIAHGSRESQANEAFLTFLDKFRNAYPGRRVKGAFLELSKPSIKDALEQIIAEGSDDIFVIPLMFFPGRHVKQDIPGILEEVKARHPQVDFHYGGPLADHPGLIELLELKAQSLKGAK